jgi:hypothetical protein
MNLNFFNHQRYFSHPNFFSHFLIFSIDFRGYTLPFLVFDIESNAGGLVFILQNLFTCLWFLLWLAPYSNSCFSASITFLLLLGVIWVYGGLFLQVFEGACGGQVSPLCGICCAFSGEFQS